VPRPGATYGAPRVDSRLVTGFDVRPEVDTEVDVGSVTMSSTEGPKFTARA
jgi:hypothetical protein